MSKLVIDTENVFFVFNPGDGRDVIVVRPNDTYEGRPSWAAEFDREEWFATAQGATIEMLRAWRLTKDACAQLYRVRGDRLERLETAVGLPFFQLVRASERGSVQVKVLEAAKVAA